MFNKFKYKRKGALAIPIAALAVLYMLLATITYTLTSSSFSMLVSQKTAFQAQQYAEIDANSLQLLDYDSTDSYAHTRQAIDDSKIITAAGWEDEISISPETVVDATQNTKQKIATIKIYKTGDLLSRSTVEVPLSSKGSSICPVGTILPYIGSLANIPKGWYLCDGNNGTPDLLGRVLEGVISSPGAFIAAGLPNITGSFSAIHDNYGYSRTGAIETSDGIRNMNIQGGNIGTTGFTFNASWVNSIYGNSNTVQPPAYTVYYIIRIN